MYQKIVEYSRVIEDACIARRRDFHKYPEMAWMEMRTSAIIAKTLTELGYQVLTGKDAVEDHARMGVPSKQELEAHALQVLKQQVPEEYLTEEMKEGYTGVVGILYCGEGPVIALRFDIDALGLIEHKTQEHRPTREGFASVNDGVMHACGHDGHAAIGLGVAEVLMKIKDSLHGTVKLLFQPGEEGTRGAKAMVAKGWLDDVDYFSGTHLAPADEENDGDVTPGSYGSLATSKYDVTYYGNAAHAGGFPEKGNNAIWAAANAVVNLLAIPRHSEGSSRVNVGMIQGGTGRNVIPDEARIQIEVRGETTEINRYMEACAKRICQASADLAGCTCEMKLMGMAESEHSDEDFLTEIGQLVREHLSHLKVSSCENVRIWGSEDISLMMNRVQEHGGKATFMRSVTAMAAGQHTTAFDFDEKVLTEAIQVFSSIVYHWLKGEKDEKN